MEAGIDPQLPTHFHVNRGVGLSFCQPPGSQRVAKRAIRASGTGRLGFQDGLFRSPKQAVPNRGMAHTGKRMPKGIF